MKTQQWTFQTRYYFFPNFAKLSGLTGVNKQGKILKEDMYGKQKHQPVSMFIIFHAYKRFNDLHLIAKMIHQE